MRRASIAVCLLLVCLAAASCATVSDRAPAAGTVNAMAQESRGTAMTRRAERPLQAKSSCPSTLASRLKHKVGKQLIFVVVGASSDTSATLTTFQLDGSCWKRAAGPWTARVGYNGISIDKHEGDGTTPAGIYGFQATMYGNAANPGVQYTYHRLACGDWWDEDSSSSRYNEFVHVPCSDTNPPFNNGSSERLWQETVAYPSFAVINYNPRRTPGRGSAIFLHADIGGPTAGCVSLPLADLDAALDWMNPSVHPSIVIGTTKTVTSY